MAEVVLDASALLAVIGHEPGAEVVTPRLDMALMSAVNLAEVASKVAYGEAGSGRDPRIVETFPFRVEPFDSALAVAVGLLRPLTARRGLSIGDRACLALARREGLPALTADRAWEGLDIGVEIRLIR